MTTAQPRYTLNQHTYSRLRNLILSGRISLGSQLDEKTLSAELDVSRTPLREAIAQLVKEGLVEHRPYRGNFVRTITAKQADDLYQVRKVLEGLAVRLATPKLSQEHLKNIRSILEDVGEANERGDMAAFTEADMRFHSIFPRLTANETLIETLNRLVAHIQLIRIKANQDPEVVRRTVEERPRILAALEARDGDLAAHLMEEHMEGVRRSVVATLEAWEGTTSSFYS